MLLDERWFVDIGEAEAESRLVRRHVLTGVAKDMAEAKWRADENDMPSTYSSQLSDSSTHSSPHFFFRWSLYQREHACANQGHIQHGGSSFGVTGGPSKSLSSDLTQGGSTQ